MADFIAAVEVSSDSDNETRGSIGFMERFARIESGLLYLYARYDSCARGVLSYGPRNVQVMDNSVAMAADYCFRALERLCRLELYQPVEIVTPSDNEFVQYESVAGLTTDTIVRLYRMLADIVRQFTDWLTNGASSEVFPIELLDDMIEALVSSDGSTSLTGSEFSRIHHLCRLLRLCAPDIGQRALVHVVPRPPEWEPNLYSHYLQARAIGDEGTGSRAVLWPSALSYIEKAVVGDSRHVVVSMPTGSGKSFIAELAVSQAIANGWALYLTPTNALAEQVRGDLRDGLAALGTSVYAFIGDREYSVLSNDRVNEMPVNSVAVMTPEKCALAVRISPHAFSNCRLVVFDECHLLGDTEYRGPLAEILLGQLICISSARFLLMSALVQNPASLVEWLSTATQGSGTSIEIKWRPTRSLRTVLGVDYNSLIRTAKDAEQRLSLMPKRRKRLDFNPACALAVSLRGAWNSTDEPDYAVIPIDCTAPLAMVRSRLSNRPWNYKIESKSWVNGTATAIASTFINGGIQTLVFTPANRHYPFVNARKLQLPQHVVENRPQSTPIVTICKTLSEYELGHTSMVFELLTRGIAVHTSIMLETEKIGSEAAFRTSYCPLMYATGTLAQGLNLPAIAVVIAGTRIGDPREQNTVEAQKRRLSQLLNAAGRAGRAGFANQGVVIAIPDKPIHFQDFDDVLQARRSTDYLQKTDACISVESGLRGFLDQVCEHSLTTRTASALDLQVMSLIGGDDHSELEPHVVLNNTFAAYLRSRADFSAVTPEDARNVVAIGEQFMEETRSPSWLKVAAQRAGLDFFVILSIGRTWMSRHEEFSESIGSLSVLQWVDILVQIVHEIPPLHLSRHIPKERLKNISEEFAKLDDGVFLADELRPEQLDAWRLAWSTSLAPLRAWMKGHPIVDIAAIICGCSSDTISSDRGPGKPLPKALSIVGETWSSLAVIAGGLLAVVEQHRNGVVPLSLSCLPMCIKYGCDSPETLAWYRFGVRLRRASRLLSRRFPMSIQAATDDDLRSWVVDTRRQWLRSDSVGHIHDEEEMVLLAIRRFILGS